MIDSEKSPSVNPKARKLRPAAQEAMSEIESLIVALSRLKPGDAKSLGLYLEEITAVAYLGDDANVRAQALETCYSLNDTDVFTAIRLFLANSIGGYVWPGDDVSIEALYE